MRSAFLFIPVVAVLSLSPLTADAHWWRHHGGYYGGGGGGGGITPNTGGFVAFGPTSFAPTGFSSVTSFRTFGTGFSSGYMSGFGVPTGFVNPGGFMWTGFAPANDGMTITPRVGGGFSISSFGFSNQGGSSGGDGVTITPRTGGGFSISSFGAANQNVSGGDTSLAQAIQNLNNTLAITNKHLEKIAEGRQGQGETKKQGESPEVQPLPLGGGITPPTGFAPGAKTGFAGFAGQASHQSHEAAVQQLLTQSAAQLNAANAVYQQSVQQHKSHKESLDRMKKALGLE